MAVGELRPVVDRPALVLEPVTPRRPRRLIVADIHLGLGGEEPRTGVPPATSARAMADELLGLARQEGSRHLLIAGDVKHPIVGTPRALRPVVFDFFATLLSAGLAVDVVPGNHDVGLPPVMPREVRVRSAEGIVVDGVGVFHGHRWPATPVLRAKRLVSGHLHPGVRLAPSPERPAGKEKCWVRVEFPPAPKVTADRADRIRATEMVVLPAFNPLAGTEALNREKPHRGRSFLFRRFLGRGTARAYLLDGTDLGRLPTPGIDPRSAAARRSATPH